MFEKFLVLPALKSWLGARPETDVALMSGSGATVFAALAEGEDGEALLADLNAAFGDSTWCCQGWIGR